jgi:hypothetical protein
MLDCEKAIQACVNEVGALATGEALKQFDADGRPIVILTITHIFSLSQALFVVSTYL